MRDFLLLSDYENEKRSHNTKTNECEFIEKNREENCSREREDKRNNGNQIITSNQIKKFKIITFHI